MKKIYIFIFIAILTTVATAEPLPRLRAHGNSIIDEKGKPVILRGVSIPYLSQARDRSVTQRIDMAVDEWKANVIRLPLFGPHRSLDPVLAHEKYIKDAVAHCVTKGIYCIIDLHFIDDLRTRLPYVHHFWYYVVRYMPITECYFELYNEDDFGGDKNSRSWTEYKT